jgi:hypothetical protein
MPVFVLECRGKLVSILALLLQQLNGVRVSAVAGMSTPRGIMRRKISQTAFHASNGYVRSLCEAPLRPGERLSFLLAKKLRAALGKAFLTSALSMTYTGSGAVYTEFYTDHQRCWRPKLGRCLQRSCRSFLGQRLEVRRLPPPHTSSVAVRRADRLDGASRSAVRIAW